MDLGGIMLSEISQTGKDKHSMLSLTCGILIKKKKKMLQTHRYREQREVTSGKRKGEGGKTGVWN